MVYARKRKSYGGRKTKRSMRKRMSSKPNALSIAKKALKLASRTANATVETKYLSYSETSDLVNNAVTAWGSCLAREITTTAATSPLFNSDALTGNKAYYKGIKGTWEIHMDNTNNEEETVNFTVAVVSARQDADVIVGNGNVTSHVSTIQGQTYFDPRFFRIHYYKHFTRTMGGTSPGTAGEMTKHGKFYVPINKMIRLSAEGTTGGQTNSSPLSYQDRMWFVVFTDNTSADLENPRINYRTMLICKDTDINT